MAQVRGAGPGRQERGIPDALLVGIIAFLLGLTVLVWTATRLSALLAHGSWPEGTPFTRTPMAMRELVAEPHDLAAAWPDAPAGALSGWGLFWGVFVGQLMVLVVVVLAAMMSLARWRARRRTAAKAAAGDAALAATGGGQQRPEQPQRPSTPAHEADTTPPTAQPPYAQPTPPSTAPQPAAQTPHAPHPHTPAAQPAGRPAPTSDATPVTAAAPTTPAPAVPGGPPPGTGPVVFRRGAPTAVGRTRETLLGAEGPALVVTSDPALWADTKDPRAKLGPVLVYDPGHLCDTPDRLRWSPASGCTDRLTADARATALLHPVRPQHRTDTTVADTAETMLACWLHAVALADRPFAHVHRWSQGTGAHEPVRILRTAPTAASGSAGELESALTGHSDRREAAQQLVTHALESLSSVHIRNACNPTRADSVVLESFIDEGGTLYVVGEAIEDPRTRPGAMPLLTALAADVVEHGRRMAARSSAGRLDPPLTLVLDDTAAVAPIPQLPDLLATGERHGLPVLATMRSPEQARSRWPELTLGT